MTTWKKVTRQIADYIYENYEALVIIPKKLKFDGYRFEKALKIIKSDIEKDFGVEVCTHTVKAYGLRTFNELKEVRKEAYKKDKRRRQQRLTEKLKETSPDYVEFVESVKRFESGEKPGPIDPGNNYVRVLSALDNYGDSMLSKNLARNVGEDSVKEQLRVFAMYGLIGHPTQSKSAISQKGTKYLKNIESS